MSNSSKGALYWTPRILAIVFIAFISIFALDVLDGHYSFWQTMLALTIHLIPSFVLIVALILAWRWEWIGTVVFAALGLLYIWWVLFFQRHIPPPARPMAILMIDGPAFIVAWLFLANWRKRRALSAAERSQ